MFVRFAHVRNVSVHLRHPKVALQGFEIEWFWFVRCLEITRTVFVVR